MGTVVEWQWCSCTQQKWAHLHDVQVFHFILYVNAYVCMCVYRAHFRLMFISSFPTAVAFYTSLYSHSHVLHLLNDEHFVWIHFWVHLTRARHMQTFYIQTVFPSLTLYFVSFRLASATEICLKRNSGQKSTIKTYSLENFICLQL